MSANGTVQIDGLLGQVVWRKEGGRFVIARFTLTDGRACSVKGDLAVPCEGARYKLSGRWSDHPRFGRQFSFESYESEKPTDAGAVRGYLKATCKWIGPRVAEAILAAFGETRAMEILKSDPGRVAREINGITWARAEEIQRVLVDMEAEEKVALDLGRMLGGLRVPERALNRIRARWGADAPDVIRQNPYVLAREIAGIGFSTADAIAMRLQFDPKSPHRICAGILFTLEEAATMGHTCLLRRELLAAAREILKLGEDLVDRNVTALEDLEELVAVEGYVYLPDLHAAEAAVAGTLAAMVQTEISGDPLSAPERVRLSNQQFQAVELVRSNRVVVVNGAAGTGKTYSVRAFLDGLPAGVRVALCAPTGKAARRLTESSGLEATTIHRLLEPQVVEKDEGTITFAFQRNGGRPLEVDVLVVDESSMLDIRLFSQLLEALNSKTRVILVGDPYQLASVGPGKVLADLVGSGVVPFFELREIHRQEAAGMIIRNCHRVRDGLPIEINNSSPDFFFIESDDPEEIHRQVVSLAAERLPKHFNVDPIRDVQVITANREKTQLGAKPLNESLQARLNKNQDAGFGRFRLGDKVIQTRNVSLDGTEFTNGGEEMRGKLFVANGDIGIVIGVDIEARQYLIEFSAPRRIATAPMVENDLQLAYAITVHKFQGSEAPVVVVPIHSCAGPMLLQRSWLYTAMSRARKALVLVGQRAEVMKAIGRNQARVRHSRLAKLLREQFEKMKAI